MGNENERKRDPADNRQRDRGHDFDDAKTGGGEQTVGLTGATGFGKGGGADSNSVGSVGTIGGSADFLTGDEATGEGSSPETSKTEEVESSGDRERGSK